MDRLVFSILHCVQCPRSPGAVLMVNKLFRAKT